MMFFGLRHEMLQLLVAFLMCVPLSGRIPPTRILSNNMTTVSPNDAESNKTTSYPKLWFQLTEEDGMKIRITTMSLAVVGALLNLLVIIAIVFDPLKRVRRGPWVTILNLATADLFTCISAFCLWGEVFFNKTQSDLYSVMVDFGWLFGVSASFLLVTFFTVQVFLLTKFPLKSRYWLTTLNIAVVCIALWLFACLLGFAYIAWLHFPGLVSLKIYIAQIFVLQITVLIQIILNILVTVEVIRSGRRTGNAQNAKHRNIAKTVILLSLVLYLTAFPYFVMKQIEYFVSLDCFDECQIAEELYGLSYCYVPISILNFGANPILYSLRLPDYRQTLLAFVGKKKKRSTEIKANYGMFTLQSQLTSQSS